MADTNDERPLYEATPADRSTPSPAAEAPAIACDWTVFDSAERSAHTGNVTALFAGAHALTETEWGYAFQLGTDAASLRRAADFIAHEGRCCPFFRFDLRVTPTDDRAWLEISGGEGVKGYMQDQLLPRLEAIHPDWFGY
jgi:hypothetical protein